MKRSDQHALLMSEVLSKQSHGMLVVGRGKVITSIGVIIGVVLSLFLTRVLQGFLFEIHPKSPVIFLIAAAVLMAASFIAVCIPGRRATSLTQRPL
jgi:ABC-type antimicrobial peptide transport system permease subunit